MEGKLRLVFNILNKMKLLKVKTFYFPRLLSSNESICKYKCSLSLYFIITFSFLSKYFPLQETVFQGIV